MKSTKPPTPPRSARDRTWTRPDKNRVTQPQKLDKCCASDRSTKSSTKSWAKSWAKLRECAVGALALLLACLTPAPAAATDWLVLLVDRSNSIDPEELRLQREAYIRLLTDEAVVRALSDTQVAIVEFDSRTELVTGWTSAQGAAQRYSRRSPDGLRGQTGIGHAVELALGLLAGKQGRKVIDISGDGMENVDRRLLTKVRRKAAERAIEINGLAIDNDPEVDISDYYLQHVATGFVLPVERREDFYEALRNKLFLEMVGREAPPESLDAAADDEAAP